MKALAVSLICLTLLIAFGVAWYDAPFVEWRERTTASKVAETDNATRLEIERASLSHEIDTLKVQQSAVLDMERERLLSPFKTAAIASFMALPVLGLLMFFDFYRLRRNPLVWAKHGQLPVARVEIEQGQLTAPSVALLGQFHQTQSIMAARQEVPHTYAPHYTVKDEKRLKDAVVEVEEVAQELLLPERMDLSQVVERPTLDRILLGLGKGGERIEVAADGLCHVALAGATGGGKSNIGRSLLAQLIAAGAKVVIADPHFAPIDPKSGEDWRPIASRLHMPPAVKINQIADMLAWFCNDELQKRLDMRQRGERWGNPIFLYVDELPAIAAKMPNVSELLAHVLREGRKVDVLLIAAAQDFLVKTLGGSGAVRDCYRTAFYVGGDAQTARVLLDVRGNVDDGNLGKGVVMLRTGNRQAQLARVPYANNESIYRLLGQEVATSNAPSIEIPVTPNDTPSISSLDPKSERIRTMLKKGMTTSEIVKEIWQVTGGTQYQKATREYHDILRGLV